MPVTLTVEQVITAGLDNSQAEALVAIINPILEKHAAEEAWRILSRDVLKVYPFSLHLQLFSLLFPGWQDCPAMAAVYMPDAAQIANANITAFMKELQLDNVKALQRFSTENYSIFWERILKKLAIVFQKKPHAICDLSQGAASPVWLPEAKLNITDSCFTAPAEQTAIIYKDPRGIQQMSFGELNQLANQIANSLLKQGFTAGDAIGIVMPMNHYAVAIYLGIIKLGAVVVSIADSFSNEEMALRLRIAQAKGVFTQDILSWGGKTIALYEKVKQASTIKTIVLPHDKNQATTTLRETDIAWGTFLVEKTDFSARAQNPMNPSNILFSSGTTGEPKAIVWNHTTAIKAASDAYFHQNIKPGDILAWPTNLGWMMGPWLIYAAFINQAAIALYNDAPKDRGFGEFIQDAKVTMLGVIPALVAAWRQTQCMEHLNWDNIKVFASTGECSNAEDMFYLMSLANYKPVIEYCGGTEIGGAYVTSTVIQNNYPSLFSTPAMGLAFTIIDEDGNPADAGEVAIIPPSIGLSTQLLNADHYQVYFSHMPHTADGKVLRRHGDQIRRVANGYYSIEGRVDDTMNLGGIKTSAVEIERVLTGLTDIKEVAAIAARPPQGGPSLLIIYAATSAELDKLAVLKSMQQRINNHLNPLFKIHDVIFINDLPKTASNKIMRRVLRKKYEEADKISS